MDRPAAPDADRTTLSRGLVTAAKVAAWTLGSVVALLAVAVGLFVLVWWAAWHGL